MSEIHYNVTLKEDTRPLVTESIHIREIKDATDSDPKYAYACTRRGQGNYLMHRCKEENLNAIFSRNQVMIYSRTKVPLFSNLILESFQFDNKTNPPCPSTTVTYWEGQAVLGVLVEGRVYVVDDKFSTFVLYEYKKKLPRFKEFTIFKRKKDMEEFLEREKGIIL